MGFHKLLHLAHLAISPRKYRRPVILRGAVFQAERRACPERSRRDLPLWSHVARARAGTICRWVRPAVPSFSPPHAVSWQL